MNQLTYDEQQMVAIYYADTRTETIQMMEEMRSVLGADEPELQALTDSTLQKLHTMTDAEFDAVDVIPDFGDTVYG